VFEGLMLRAAYECVGCRDCQPEGEQRPDWEKRSADSYMFGKNRYTVYRDHEAEKWVGSFWEMSSQFDKLWQAQQWVEECERERFNHERNRT
jgi:hypothetical protein